MNTKPGIAGGVDVLAVLNEAESWLPLDHYEDERFHERYMEAIATVEAIAALPAKWREEIDAYDRKSDPSDPEDWMEGKRECLADIEAAFHGSGPATGGDYGLSERLRDALMYGWRLAKSSVSEQDAQSLALRTYGIPATPAEKVGAATGGESGERELIRRLYVELLWCDRQLVGKGCKQGGSVRDALADALAYLESTPKAATPAGGGDLPELPRPWQCETAMCPDLYTAEQMRAYGHQCRLASAPARVGDGWVLYGTDDEHTPWACYCPDRDALLREVADTVFAATEDLDDRERQEVAEIAEALIESGRFDFEGDPTIYLRAAAPAQEPQPCPHQQRCDCVGACKHGFATPGAQP